MSRVLSAERKGAPPTEWNASLKGPTKGASWAAESLSSGRCCLVAMLFRMEFGRFRRMVGGVMQVTLRCVSVVSGSLMVASLVMLSRFMMMHGCVFVVLCCFSMVFCCFLGHKASFFKTTTGPRGDCALVVKGT